MILAQSLQNSTTMTDRIYSALVQSMLPQSPFQTACLALGSRLEEVARAAIASHSAEFPLDDARVFAETVHDVMALANRQSVTELEASNTKLAADNAFLARLLQLP